MENTFALLKGRLPLITDQKNPQFSLRKKYRWVDPGFIQNGKVYILSEVDKEYAALLAQERQHNKEGIKVSFLKLNEKPFI